MEVAVTKDTKCTQNKAFVKWNESHDNMFGVRFAKESQANQVKNALNNILKQISSSFLWYGLLFPMIFII